MKKNTSKVQRGAALLAVLLLISTLMVLLGAMLSQAISAKKAVATWRTHDQCLLRAQSAMDKVKYDLYTQFKAYFNAAPAPKLSTKFSWFDTWSSTSVGSNGAYTMPVDLNMNEGYTATAVLKTLANTGRSSRTLGIEVTVTAPDGRKRILFESVRYRMAPSQVFDYAYFVNNFGWFWGSTITAHGNVRANGNFSFNSGPKLNGDVTGGVNAALGTTGTVTGAWNFDTMANYRSSAPARARPTNPPDDSYNGIWRQGYDANPKAYPAAQTLDMPYIADLTDYEYLANNYGGQIKINGVVVVDKVYSGDGPDGVAGTADDGMLVLTGTTDKPITITGPVVVRGDVVISGVVTGQGTIYSGRNVHIPTNLTYKNVPTWTKPDTNPGGTVTANASKDLLGLAAKGNIILGDYRNSTWQSNTASYMKPTFTTAYDTDASDANIGYDSDKNGTNGYRFNADYTAKDGGQKKTSSGFVDRKYYESSNDVAFAATNPVTNLSQVDAVLYTNHLLSGYVGGITFNGAIIARDEAIIFTTKVNFNWDIRIGSESPDGIPIDIYLPRSLVPPDTQYWRETH